MSDELGWWESDKPHVVIFDHVKRIRSAMSPLRQAWLHVRALYKTADVYNGFGNMLNNAPDLQALALNVIRPNVDTCTTGITKARPLPMPITRDGDYSQQRQARRMGKALEGQWIRSKVFETNFQIVRNAALYGTGFSYSYSEKDKLCYDSIFPWEVDVDPQDALYGNPRVKYLTRNISRRKLKKLFPSKKAILDGADFVKDESFSVAISTTADVVTVRETWVLPSYEGAGDGYHGIAVSSGMLLKEEYDQDSFPVKPFYLMPPPDGYYGDGIGIQLSGIQHTITTVAVRCQEQAALAPCHLVVDEDSNIQLDHLDDSAWPIISKKPGSQVLPIQAPPFNPAMFEFLKQLMNMSFDQTGVSQQAAQAELPAALREASGIALQLHNENRSERFNIASRLYETFCVDNAWLHFYLMSEIGKKYPGYSISTPSREAGKRVLAEIKWKDVAMDRDSFTLDVFPTTMLHAEPTMKAAQVESWTNAGWLSPDEARMLLEFPDLDKVNSLQRAKYEILDSIFEKFLDPDNDPMDPDTYIAPEPLFDLNLCLAKAIPEYLRAKLNGVEEERLQLFRDFILDTQDLIRQMQGSEGASSQVPPQGGMNTSPSNGEPPAPQPEAPMGPPPNPEGMMPSDLAQMGAA